MPELYPLEEGMPLLPRRPGAGRSETPRGWECGRERQTVRLDALLSSHFCGFGLCRRSVKGTGSTQACTIFDAVEQARL